MRTRLIITALATLAIGLGGQAAASAALGTALPLQGVDSIVIDQAHGQVFVSGDSPSGTTSLLVANADGSLKTTVSDEQGARGMALDGGTLYVARCNPNHSSPAPTTGVIDVIDTATLARIDSFPIAIAPSDPQAQGVCNLALAGGRLWVAAGTDPTGLTAVDVAAPHAQHSYDVAVNAGAYAAAPGDPNTLVAIESTTPSRVVSLDVSGATPTGTASYITQATQIAVSDDGATLFAQSFDGIHAYSLPDMTELGIYPAGGQISGEAVSGDGSLVVEALFGGVRLFHGGSFASPFATIAIANGITNVALSTDGSDLYAATAGDLGPTLYHIHGPALPAPKLTVAVSKRNVSYRQRVRITVNLAGTHTNRVVDVYQVAYGGSARLIGSGAVDAEGNLSIISPRLAKNTRFFATYAGDATSASATSAAAAVTVHVIARLSLLGSYGHSGPYRLYHYTSACPSRGSGCPTFVGSVIPNHAGHLLTFLLQRHTSSGWRTIAKARFKLNSNSIAAARWVYSSSSIIGQRLRSRVTFAADADHGGDASPWHYLEITR